MGGDGKQEVNKKTDGRMLSGSVCLGGNREQAWQSGVTLSSGIGGRLFPTLAGQSSSAASIPWPLDCHLSGVWVVGRGDPPSLTLPGGAGVWSSFLPAASDVITKRNTSVVAGSLKCPSAGRDGDRVPGVSVECFRKYAWLSVKMRL